MKKEFLNVCERKGKGRGGLFEEGILGGCREISREKFCLIGFYGYFWSVKEYIRSMEIVRRGEFGGKEKK